jgi:hypothetical protein
MSSDSDLAVPALTKTQHDRALVQARAYLRSAEELYERARVAAEVATARLIWTERTLRIARQVLVRIEMLGVQFERN